MVYIMKIEVDGACRGNGQPASKAVAAACFINRWGSYEPFAEILNGHDFVPTNQRAEILAIIIALKHALDKYDYLSSNPYLDVEIFSDSKYAIGFMTDWRYKWTRNGWRNAAGNPVANYDLISRAFNLDDKLKEKGTVKYTWIDRDQNQIADRVCNESLDSL